MKINRYLNKNLTLLFIIILVAGILRFWGLSTNPPSLYWDEVSQGYNSYSILKTGHDEHKELLPIARFKAFGDYKAPVYIYLDVPFIALFGETPMGVRFPSALFGTLTVFFTYLLVKQMFKPKLKTENLKLQTQIQNLKLKNSLEIENCKLEIIALLSALFLAISPWHIQLSRAAYEGNIATFFTVLGVYLFFLAKNKHATWFILSGMSFVLGFYAFNAHRVFIPLLIIALAIIYFKDIFTKKNLKYVLLSSLLALILILPFLFYLKTPESKLRFNEVNIFTDSSIITRSNTLMAEGGNTLLSRVLYNRRVLFANSFIKHYFDFFNPGFLFFTGDVNPRFSMQDSGQLYLWELPLLLFGVYMLVKYKNKESVFIFTWFILAPVAAATARETPHALRAETYLPLYEIIAAFGLVSVLMKLDKLKLVLKRLGYFFVVAIIITSAVFFVHNYFTHFPKLYSSQWQYGYKQAVEYAKSQEGNFDTIAFTQSYGRPYIYVLFYGNISPQIYWAKGRVTKDQFGFYNVKNIGKYEFRDVLIQSSDLGKRVLYVGAPGQISGNLHILKTVNFLNGEKAFVIAKN